ncbi:X-ray repair cross-complementing protein 6 [Contarinia nasturtii]|uniref:X-ray repair cross-complementing protein 6 n=1 Tax=Contarinia nasturtii TaxID=265458 RepID=UPI0012D40723|nr:X-ray repair cross-complementing protein 6 [Contarinia nasturtii]XP_031625668.1 X-ray repair cross-complementing protein 6 [Contarinia nasturtii]
MSEWNLNDGIEDVDDEEKVSFTGRDGTIYLIDADISKNEEHFFMCLSCIEEDLLKGILANSRDMVSVVFYNTKNSPPPSAQLTDNEDTNIISAENCATFIPLKPLSKNLIQYFKNFRQSSNFFNFNETHGISNGSSFSEALWLCSRLIIRCNYRLHRSRIILFTNNELPYMNGTKEQNDALIRAKDLLDNKIDVDLVPLVDEFNMDAFYMEFLSAASGIPPDELRLDSPATQREHMLHRHPRRNNRKSCLRHINFELADSVSLSCNIYSLTRKARKPNAINMLRENKEIVLAKRSYVVEQQSAEDPEEVVQREVLPGQMFKGQMICGKEILFSSDEMKKMKEIQDVGLRLLGFKPLAALKPRWMIKHCLFLYPSEKKINGSTKVFRALWEKCLEKEKYALCTLTMRRLTSPKYVALVPQTIASGGNDGFCIVFLPVETNIGVIDALVKPLPDVTPEQQSLSELLCKKLRFKYSPENFPNPALNLFYKRLEETVYDDEEMEDVIDATLPDLGRQDEQLVKYNILERFFMEFGTEDVVTSGKRGAGGQGDGTRAKTSKKDLSESQIEEAIRNGRIEAVTVPQIKDFIRSRNAHAPNGAKQALFEFSQRLID